MLLTPDLRGVGGRIKVEPEDFEVEEVPAYEPCGAGEHLYLWVEKRGVGPEFFLKGVARRLDIPVGEVGTAGLKDRHAVTRQWVSVPQRAEANLPNLDGDGVKLLKQTRHGNKLRPGHLRGNRFRILVRDADPSKADAVPAVLARVRELGLPNFYGPQRFGHDGETAALGLAMIRNERTPRVSPFLRKFALSAAQSAVFNDWLARRLADGIFRTVLPGDVCMKWPGGGLFTSTDAAADQPRFDARELVVGGPMFGAKTFPAAGVAAEREREALAGFGLTPEAFAGFGKLMSGTRRHAQVYVDDLAAEWEPDGLRLTFTLPAGSYATVLLREVMKADVTAEETADE